MCAKGRPVLCRTFANGRAGFLPAGQPRFLAEDGSTIHHFGPATYSPLTVVHESQAIRIDPSIPLDVASMIGCAVTTGVGSVLNTAGCRPGMSVAVFGCGGVGMSAVQGAVLGGALPIAAVDVAPARLELAIKLGATDTVVAGSDRQLEKLEEISGGGFDITVLAVGSTAAFETAWAATGPGGTCIVVGKPPEGSTIPFDPGTLLAGERRLLGSSYGSSRPSIDFPMLARLYQAGILPLESMLGQRYEPSEANVAFEDLLDGKPGRGLIMFPEVS
jgi:Zn-dependent alcohol dehydrogenase